MDIVQAVGGYVSKMVSAGDDSGALSNPKMKILLLDSETVRCTDSPRSTLTDRLGLNHLHSDHPICTSQP